LATAATTGWRGLYVASNGECFGVAGNTLYLISTAWTLTSLGTISASPSRVSMFDNGTDLVIVDGSASGWSVNLSSHAFNSITDADFLGSNFVAYLDTYLLFNQPGTRNFFSSDSNAITFDPLYIAAKTATPDLLVGIAVTHRDIWLIGAKNTEIWYNAGATPFPFQLTPGAFVDHGCLAQYTIATHGAKLFWLGQDKNGALQVYKAEAYKVERISTHAIEYQFGTYSTVTNAYAFTYQQEGHIFYVMCFPSANEGRGATWVYDLRTELWHERVWLDLQGRECMVRANCAAYFSGKTIVGDHTSGKLYEWSLNAYTDDGSPIIRRRGFPPIVAEGKRVTFDTFWATIEGGNAASGEDVQIFLRWSDDLGKTYGTPIGQSLGDLGEYLTQPQWNRLGYSRYRCFELFWSVNAKTSLSGAYLPAPLPMGT